MEFMVGNENQKSLGVNITVVFIKQNYIKHAPVVKAT